MESSKSRRLEKRGHEQIAEDAADYAPDIKRPKLPALASVIVEALKVDSLQRLSSSLEPLLRRIFWMWMISFLMPYTSRFVALSSLVSEEVERALTKYGHATPTGRSTPPRIQRPQGRNLQLHFRTKMPPQLFTGGKVEGEQGAAIHVVLLEMNSGSVVQSGPEASAKLSVVVLEGDFNEEDDDDWTNENFKSYEVKEREGKRPLLAGDLQVSLKEGVGTLGELSFTDNSSWIRSRKFRLGVKVAPGYSEEIHIREAKTNAFAVKDHRGELYKKHYPPALHDEVWRLDRIAKDGALHKKLLKADIVTVEDFLRLLVRDPQNLRNILGSGMSNRMWENTVEHAKTCVLGGKLYVYYADQSNGSGIVFNHIYELRGLIASGQFIQLDSLTDNQKMSVDFLVKQAYENWHQVIEYDGKVLISQVSSRGERKSLLAPTAHRNSLASHNLVVQNMQQHNTSGSVLTYENQNNYYSMRPDQTDGVVSNYPQGALMAGTDYSLAGTSGQRNSYYSGEWSQQRSGQGLEDMISEEIRLRSSEMLRAEEMQNLLKTFGLGFGGGLGTSCNNSVEACYSYGGPCEKQVDRAFGHERGTSGKAVVGWLKLKAALRWGIFVRKRAAERRAHLVELD